MKNMKLYYILIVAAAAAMTLVSDSSLSVENTPAGMVTFVDGTVKKKDPTLPDWTTAGKDTTVSTGDQVRTMINSRAELELRELDVIRLAPRTTIDIVKLFEETKMQKDQTQINVVEGDIWAMVSTVQAGAEFNLNTPVAGAAITGTVFRVSVEEDSSTQLKVYQGEVHIGNAMDNPHVKPQYVPAGPPRKTTGPSQVSGPRQVSLEEWMYIVKNMQVINISKSGKVLSAGDFSATDKEEQSDWVKWNMERDKERGH